jgi:hypothetical protein
MFSYMDVVITGLQYFDGEITDKKTGELKQQDTACLFYKTALDARYNKPGQFIRLGCAIGRMNLQNSAVAKELEIDGRLQRFEEIPARLKLLKVTNGQIGDRAKFDEYVAGVEVLDKPGKKAA